MKKTNLLFFTVGIISLLLIFLPSSFFVNVEKNKTDNGNITRSGILLPHFNFSSIRGNPLIKKIQDNKSNSEPDENWLANAKKYIEKDEYNLEYDKNCGEYTAFNRKNNLRFTYSLNGFKTEPGITKIPLFDTKDKFLDESKKKYKELPLWQTNIKLEGFGRNEGNNLKRFYGKELIAKDNSASIEDENLRISYLNDESGMRQDFIVKNRPDGNGKLVINLNIKTKEKVKIENDGITFRKAKTGEELYGYKGLKIWDKSGRELKGRFVNVTNYRLGNKNIKINIEIEDADSEYPITIDPLSSIINWIGIGESNNNEFGFSVSTAGDVNGDGYSDVVIGAYNYSSALTPNRGRVYVYYGNSSGLPVSSNWFASGEDTNNYFGISVSTAGDVNGDGYSDIIVGAYGYSSNKGKVYVYQGSGFGILGNTPAWTVTGENNNDRFGISVSTAGDVNGDGYSDVIIGAMRYSFSQGKVYVYYGGIGGLYYTPAWTQIGENYNDFFGCSISTAGDVNGDGYSDIIIGADWSTSVEGKVYVYYGSSSGLLSTPNWTKTGENDGDYFGCSVSTAGDVNGDGYSDIIVGALGFSDSSGKAYVYYGSSSGLLSTPNWTATGENVRDEFGCSVSAAGDVNGDGYSSVIIGALGYSSYKGKVYVYYGSSSGLSTTTNWTTTGEYTGDEFGISVSTAGDVNGDGYSDVLMGAPNYSAHRGEVFACYGSPYGLTSTPKWTKSGENANDYFGCSVSTAGDINGDGYSDVIIGAYTFSSNKGKVYAFYGSHTGLPTTPNWTATGENNSDGFGNSVSTAGDVNGDGYSDVIIGAFNYSSGKGKVYVYSGSSTGLSATANWTATGESTGNRFGISVSTAGDVNGDGYSDVIVGAYFGSSYKGKAYVYYGSNTGLSATPNWTATGENTNDWFGNSVSTAGHVNGDRFSDVIIGAYGFSSEKGKVYVYYGSSSGLSTTANWTAIGENNNDLLGCSVSTAGDVNGDGYSDVIIGAYGFPSASNKGKSYVFLGSSTGLQGASSWTATGEAIAHYFGGSVSTAGDVNGDGYSDVIIGAYGYTSNKGKVYVYYGSPTGVSTTANWSAMGESTNNYFGSSVSTAGDVNGDGYSDVIIGAYGYSSNTGKANVFYGNSVGTRSTLQQYRPGTSIVIGPGGNSTVIKQVRLSLFCRSPFGRTQGKLVYEYKDENTPFSGNPITNSTAYTGMNSNWTDLTIAGIQINNDIIGIPSAVPDYKWRVRVKYNPSSNPYQVYGPWKYYKNYAPIPTGGFKPFDQVGIRELETVIPTEFKLCQNYPNPFNPETKIKFDIPESVKHKTLNVKLIIYDILGKEIATLVNESLQPGTYEVTFDATKYSSGIYFYKLITEGFSKTEKMLMIK